MACTLRILSRTTAAQPRYRMHRLVRAVHRETRAGAALDAPPMARLVAWFRERREATTGTTAFEGEADHLEAARALCEAQPDLHDLATLYWLEAYIPQARGDYRAALGLVDRAQAAWTGGHDDATALQIATDRAGLQSSMGDVRPALEALEDIVARAEQSAAPAEVRVDALQALAHKQHLLGRKLPARATAALAVALAEATWGEDHGRTAEARSAWAVYAAQVDQSDAAQAVQHARQALELLRAAYGPGDWRALTAHDDLGNCLTELGDHEAAIAVGREVLLEHERFLGSEHPRTLHVVTNLAIWLNRAGSRAAARRCAERALRGFSRLYSAKHSSTVVAHIQFIWSTLGPRNSKQVALRLKALRKSLPADHPQRSRIDRTINQLTPTRRGGKKRKR